MARRAARPLQRHALGTSRARLPVAPAGRMAEVRRAKAVEAKGVRCRASEPRPAVLPVRTAVPPRMWTRALPMHLGADGVPGPCRRGLPAA